MGTIMLSAGVTIMDPIALTMIQKYGGDFGRERLFSSIGMAIFSPITGMLIDMRSKQVGKYLMRSVVVISNVNKRLYKVLIFPLLQVTPITRLHFIPMTSCCSYQL